jgi:hypothetical protein
MLTSGTPLGATSTVGRRLPGTFGLRRTIWACADARPPASRRRARLRQLQPLRRLQAPCFAVALEAPLPVLAAVSWTTMRMPLRGVEDDAVQMPIHIFPAPS